MIAMTAMTALTAVTAGPTFVKCESDSTKIKEFFIPDKKNLITSVTLN
jgi:hypothetical protein